MSGALDSMYGRGRMADDNGGLFRQKAIDRLSSPDELTDYLKVTNPSVWVVLVSVVVLLVGLFAWALVGTLPTRADASVVVRNGTAMVRVDDPYAIDEGMSVTVSSQDYPIQSVVTDEYGKTIGRADIELPDGTYDGTVVVDETRAIDFLLQSS